MYKHVEKGNFDNYRERGVVPWGPVKVFDLNKLGRAFHKELVCKAMVNRMRRAETATE